MDKLQNRRQFFKNSARKVLPFLAVPLFGSLLNSCKWPWEDEPNNGTKGDDCKNSCWGSCLGNCGGNCSGTCDGRCEGGCWTNAW